MHSLLATALCALVFVSCASSSGRRRESEAAARRELQTEFRRAYHLAYDDEQWLEKLTALGMRLHQKLREVGDDVFASALSKEDPMVQVEVVNCMGFQNPAEYNGFPKTKFVLSSAPKI